MIAQNLAVAGLVIVVLLPAAALGVVGIGTAIALHEGSTLAVVINALRLLTRRRQASPGRARETRVGSPYSPVEGERRLSGGQAFLEWERFAVLLAGLTCLMMPGGVIVIGHRATSRNAGLAVLGDFTRPRAAWQRRQRRSRDRTCQEQK